VLEYRHTIRPKGTRGTNQEEQLVKWNGNLINVEMLHRPWKICPAFRCKSISPSTNLMGRLSARPTIADLMAPYPLPVTVAQPIQYAMPVQDS
ncbi:MAG: hypothetical protein CR994_06705, partial [Maribacter sp.]